MPGAKPVPVCTETVKKLEHIRKDFLENIERIRPDLKDYHEAAFDKFVYQFHRILTNVLEIHGNLTLDELIDHLKGLSSRIYTLNKAIKEKEDELLRQKDKKLFAEIRKEIKGLVKEKEYFGVIERNISQHDLIMKLQEIAVGINRMGFSGEKTIREDAAYVMSKSDECVKKLTAVDYEQLKGMLHVRHAIKSILEKMSSKGPDAKGSGKPDAKVTGKPDAKVTGKPDAKVAGKSDVKEPEKQEAGHKITLPLKLTVEEKAYIMSRVGENYYNRYCMIVIGIIEGLKQNFSLGAVVESLRKQGWPPEYINPAMNAIKEVLQKRT